MIYRRRSTPLHAAGPAAAASWCLALAVSALIAANPAVLGVVALSVIAAALCARVGIEVARSLRWALVLALTILVINALVSQDGTTIIWSFGTLPAVGYRYITAQAVGAGAVLGLRAATLVLTGVLYSVAVDPDAVLSLARRLSFRSALTATIATRMVPVLMRDAQHLAEAQRTRSGAAPGRVALLQAATSGMLDRALDVAATLEVRGFALPDAGRGTPRLLNRHDRHFAASALALIVVVIATRLLSPWCAAIVPVVILAPFLDRRGIG